MLKTGKHRRGLSVIIVGCGKAGAALVDRLCREGHDISVVDTDARKIQEIANLYDVMGVVGNGASYNILSEAGIEKSDLIIAVTGSDELNLLCCTVAKQVGDCAAIARVRTPDYSREAGYLRERLGLAMVINPDLEAAKEAARILYLPTALEVDSFAHGQAELIKFRVPEGNRLDGITVAYLGANISADILICAVERNGDVFIPSGDFGLRAGDVISFVAPRRSAKQFLETIGFETNQVRDVMIIGGGNTTYYLANRLLRSGISVKIIENNPVRCEELSVLLPKAVIINGDGTNAELLKEEGIEDVESFVPITGIDEENVMLTLYAGRVSHAKVITKLDRTNFKEVIGGLNLGSVIYPQYITNEIITAYVRAKKNSMGSNIETLYHMFDNRVEAIEFRVDKASPVTDIPLMELSLKRDLLVAFINRQGVSIIPSGQDCIRVGDTVMIVTTHTGFNDIRNILE